MAGAEDDVRKLLDAKARREADARAAVEGAEVKRRFAQSEKDRIQSENQAKWPTIYKMLRGVFDVWQPTLDDLDLQSEYGGTQGLTRFFFKYERKDKRAFTALSFALADDGRLNVSMEKFTDTKGMLHPTVVPLFLAETEESVRPIFANAISELEAYERASSGQSRQYRPTQSMLGP